MTSTGHAIPLEINVNGLTKSFGGLRALDDVSVHFKPGRVHALLGENGAGKSTLVKCLMGYYVADVGEITVNGERHAIARPQDAHALGLGMVYQHFTLVPQMTVAENFVLGRDRLPLVINWETEQANLRDFMSRMPFQLEPSRTVVSLAAGEKQKLEILKQLYLGRRFLILDEPTSVLTPGEADEVLGEIRRLADTGQLTVVFITHKFREVVRFAQDVTVLRAGKVVSQAEAGSRTEQDLAALMFGKDQTAKSPATRSSHHRANRQGDYLDVQDLYVLGDRGTAAVDGATLTVSMGEIVGVAGVSGNGQKELVQVLAGQRDARSGKVHIEGEDFRATRRQLEKFGISLLTEEPLANAAVRSMSVMENLALRAFDRPPLAIGGILLNRVAWRLFADELISRYSIRARSPFVRLDTLSGGNVQRTLLARELSREVRLLILQNPCFGLDAGAALEIRKQIVQARDKGAAVLLISEDLDEVLEISDRVLVMSAGRITFEADRSSIDRYEIGRHMAQGSPRLSA